MMNITWLGQSGFLLEHNGVTIAIDPYLSTVVEDIKKYRRLMPPLISFGELRTDILFCSHNHFDHFDPKTVEAVIKNCPECKIYGPTSVLERAETRNMAIPNFNRLQPGDEFSLNKFHFRALPARHSDPKALGLLIEFNEYRIYFSGDTLYAPELANEIRNIIPKHIDLALLCINGQGGNMNAMEAASLASELNTSLVIPTHYGMFAENTVEPDEFYSFCHESGIRSSKLVPGIKYNLSTINDEQFVEEYT